MANSKVNAYWSEFSSMLAKVEKQRQKSQTELASLKRQQDEMLRMSPDEIAHRLPAYKRQCAECVGLLDKHARHILSAQTKLTFVLSLRESEESAAAAAAAAAASAAATAAAASAAASAAGTNATGSRVWPDSYMIIPTMKVKAAVPPLCGAVQPPPTYIVPDGHIVAAKKDEDWIVAAVVRSIKEKQTIRYEVEDVDPEEGQPKRFFALAKNIMPLPTAIPDTPRPEAEWAAGSSVMALWPGSTCFYQAKVRLPPSKRKPLNDYLIEFNSEEKDSPPTQYAVLQQFVLPFRKKYAKGQKE